MTFFHFINCLALTYAPFFIAYKYSGLYALCKTYGYSSAEYSSVWKCGQAGLGYLMTQLAKLLILATFFPAAEGEGEEFVLGAEVGKSAVDLLDWAGLYLLIFWSMGGKGEIKFLAAGLGWAAAECVATRLVPFWVGARGLGFDWKYVQMGLESNLTLVHFLSFAALVWLANRVELSRQSRAAAIALLLYSSHKSLVFILLAQVAGLGAWALLMTKLALTAALAISTLLLYSSLQSTRELNHHYHR